MEIKKYIMNRHEFIKENLEQKENWVVSYRYGGDDLTFMTATSEKEALELVFDELDVESKDELEYGDNGYHNENQDKYLIYGRISSGSQMNYRENMSFYGSDDKAIFKNVLYYEIENDSDGIKVDFYESHFSSEDGDGYDPDEGYEDKDEYISSLYTLGAEFETGELHF